MDRATLGSDPEGPSEPQGTLGVTAARWFIISTAPLAFLPSRSHLQNARRRVPEFSSS